MSPEGSASLAGSTERENGQLLGRSLTLNLHTKVSPAHMPSELGQTTPWGPLRLGKRLPPILEGRLGSGAGTQPQRPLGMRTRMRSQREDRCTQKSPLCVGRRRPQAWPGKPTSGTAGRTIKAQGLRRVQEAVAWPVMDTRQGTVITHWPGIPRGLGSGPAEHETAGASGQVAGGEAMAPFTQDSSETAGDRA